VIQLRSEAREFGAVVSSCLLPSAPADASIHVSHHVSQAAEIARTRAAAVASSKASPRPEFLKCQSGRGILSHAGWGSKCDQTASVFGLQGQRVVAQFKTQHRLHEIDHDKCVADGYM
jgi:hypothetical protein